MYMPEPPGPGEANSEVSAAATLAASATTAKLTVQGYRMAS